MSEKLELNSIEIFTPVTEDELTYCHSLIICAKTGIYWTHQYNHYACSQSSVEGFPLLVDARNIYNPCDWLDGETSLKEEADKVSESLINFKDVIGYNIEKLEFDYERIDEFKEAFIPLKIYFDKKISCTGKKFKCTVMNGYLMLDNCD